MELYVPSNNCQVPTAPVPVGHESKEHRVVNTKPINSTPTTIIADSFKSRNYDQLLDFFENIVEDNLPLISNDVAIQLLKIQSKYLDNHPYLCTSRFRHTLHQLSEENHYMLDELCHKMHDLLIESSSEIYTEDRKRHFYDQFIPTIFDRGELNSRKHLFTPPMCCKKHSNENSAPAELTHPKKRQPDNTHVGEKSQHSTDSTSSTGGEINLKNDTIADQPSSRPTTVENKTSNSNLNDYANKIVPDDNGGTRRNLEEALEPQLQAILARLVSDYRAIFAIEDEIHHNGSQCAGQPSHSYQEGHSLRNEHDTHHNTSKWNSSENLNPIVDHEHRKRHEEEDDCPEEIKSMKVACEELTLECLELRNPTSCGISAPDVNVERDPKSGVSKEKDNTVHRYYSSVVLGYIKKGNYHHNHTTEDLNRHHRYHNSNNGSTALSRRHTSTHMCISQSSQNDATPKHPNISVLKTQALSASTEDNRFPFDPLRSKHTAKEDDNISTTSLPSTPTVAAPDKPSQEWSGMPVPEQTTAGLTSVHTSEHHHMMSSGSSSTSSVCKDDARSLGSSCNKQRKRKERRDSLSDEHDKKLSRSSGSLVDDLPSNSSHKHVACNLPIKRSNSNRKKHHPGQGSTDYTLNVPILKSNCETELSNIPPALPTFPKPLPAPESNEDCKKRQLTAQRSVEYASQRTSNHQHVLQGQGPKHELTSPHHACHTNKNFDHQDLSVSLSCNKVESSLSAAAIADSSIDPLTENEITLPQDQDGVTARGRGSARTNSYSIVGSTTDDQRRIPDCISNSHRTSSEAIPIPQCGLNRVEDKNFQDNPENRNIDDEQSPHSTTNAKHVPSKEIESCSTKHHQNVPDEPDDTLSLYSSSPISCASSSSSETSEDEDENQKLQHDAHLQHRKELLELRRKLERTTDIENNNRDEGTDIINQNQSKPKYASDKKSFETNKATKIKESNNSYEETTKASDKIDCGSRKNDGALKIERTFSKVSSDNSGVGERLRRLSERSWSSTSSGELSAFSSCQDSRLTSTIQQESPVSWMPHLTLAMRESMSSQSSEGTGDGIDTMAAKACDAESQFVGTRHFGMLNSKRHLDPSHMARVTADQDSPKRTKLKQLTRQLSSVRKKLEELENEFEHSPGGYKLSHVEKHKHKPMRKLMSEQARLKRQLKNCRESEFGLIDDDMTTVSSQLSTIDNSRGGCNQVSVDRPILSMSGSSSRRSSWCENRENMLNSDAIEDDMPPSYSSTCLDRSISLDCAASLVVLASSSSSMLSSSPGGSSITSTSSGNSGSSSVGTFSSSGESCVSIGDASLGSASELDGVEEENRRDLGNSDNEDNNSNISQNMTSLLNKDVDVNITENTSTSKIKVVSGSNSSLSVDVTDNQSSLTLKNNNDSTNRNLESMRNSLIDVEQRLKAQRAVAGRPYDLEAMTSDQLVQEKVDLQSALLQFEHLFGHPESNEEKALVKDVYDRYRSVKRHVRRSSSTKSKDPLELVAIPEDVELPLTLASPQHRINIETHASSKCLDINILVEGSEHTSQLRSMDGMSIPAGPKNSKSYDGSPYDSSIAAATIHAVEANLHSMSRHELIHVQRRTREDKKRYRRTIKEREEQLLAQTGRRRIPKGERDAGDATYVLYKLAKAKLKLIDALLSKPGPLLC